MRVPAGTTALVAAAVALGLLGAVLEVVVRDVREVDRVDAEEVRFRSQTLFCPPPIGGGSGDVWVVTEAQPARVGFEPHAQQTRALPGQTLLRQDAYEEAVDVVGYDAPVAVTISHTVGATPAGIGATACAPSASEQWYFAQGSSQLEVRERLILYNPFPGDASVRVSLYREGGVKSPALLSSISVPPNNHTVVDFNALVAERPGNLGAQVTAHRGRVVAWRSLVVESDDLLNGAELSLGATAPSTTWYLPGGAHTSNTVTGIELLNPTEEEASVRVSLPTEKRLLEPPGLEALVIPPMTVRRVDLERSLQGQDIPESFGIVIDSTAPLVAERTIASGLVGGRPGRASEIGASVTATAWTLPPVARDAADDRLVVINPRPQDADVEVVLARTDGRPLRPGPLRVRVRGGRRVVLSLERWADAAPVAALVSSSGPVVAERVAYSAAAGDFASAIGTPRRGTVTP